MNNTTDIFFNNGQLDWNALSTITNTFLVLALVIITWWYAREVKKQTEFMKIDRVVHGGERHPRHHGADAPLLVPKKGYSPRRKDTNAIKSYTLTISLDPNPIRR